MRATCSEPDCDRPVRGRGLCGTHYAFARRHGTLPPRREVTATCQVQGCGRPHEAKGMCGMHYQRKMKIGDLAQPLATGPDEERFWVKVERSGPDDCWPWKAGIGSSGYGNIHWLGRTQSAHRIAWTLLRGPIPADLTIDHLCFVRHCMNPAHMELVTLAENIRRMRVTEQRIQKARAAGAKGAAIRWGRAAAAGARHER